MEISPAHAAGFTLALYPQSVQDDLLEKTSLASDVGIEMKAFITIDPPGVEFGQKTFYSGIRAAYADPEVKTIQDRTGGDWTVVGDVTLEGVKVKVSNDTQVFLVEEFFPFILNRDLRLAKFQLAAHIARMPVAKYHEWEARLVTSELNEEDALELLTLLSISPGKVEDEIVHEIQRDSTKISKLIPDNENYYFALVGRPDPNLLFVEYVERKIKPNFDAVLATYRDKGLRDLFPCCWHREITSSIDLSILTLAEIRSAIQWVAVNGDLVSKHGAVEVAIPFISHIPEVAPLLIQLIEEIRTGDEGEQELDQLCNLIRLVDGEFVRKSLFQDVQPYWRRLASFTHAATLQRSLVAVGANAKQLATSNCYGRVQQFVARSVLDVRIEPRWQISYLSPQQLKAEFLVRILHVANQAAHAMPPELHEYIFGEKPLSKSLAVPDAFIAGPLEGEEQGPSMPLPPGLETKIDIESGDGPIDVEALIPLINSAMIFKLDPVKADVASQAIRAAKFRIRTGGNTAELLQMLMGLASLAATTRSSALTDDVTQLLHYLRHRNPASLSVTQAWWIGMTAAAAHAEEDAWCTFVGGWCSQMAHQDIAAKEALAIRESLVQLCQIVPKLWLSCGQAIACLDSITG